MTKHAGGKKNKRQRAMAINHDRLKIELEFCLSLATTFEN